MLVNQKDRACCVLFSASFFLRDVFSSKLNTILRTCEKCIMRCVVCDTSRYYGTGVFSHRWLIIRTVGRWKAWKAIEADRAISRSLSFPMHEYNIFVTLATIIEIQFPRHFVHFMLSLFEHNFLFSNSTNCLAVQNFQVISSWRFFQPNWWLWKKVNALQRNISVIPFSLSVSQLLIFRSVSIRNWAERKSLRLCGFFNDVNWFQ